MIEQPLTEQDLVEIAAHTEPIGQPLIGRLLAEVERLRQKNDENFREWHASVSKHMQEVNALRYENGWLRAQVKGEITYDAVTETEARLRTEIMRYMRLNAEQVDLLAAVTSCVADSNPRPGYVVLEVKREDWERAKAASGS